MNPKEETRRNISTSSDSLVRIIELMDHDEHRTVVKVKGKNWIRSCDLINAFIDDDWSHY